MLLWIINDFRDADLENHLFLSLKLWRIHVADLGVSLLTMCGGCNFVVIVMLPALGNVVNACSVFSYIQCFMFRLDLRNSKLLCLYLCTMYSVLNFCIVQ